MHDPAASKLVDRYSARMISLISIVTIVSVVVVAAFAYITWSPRTAYARNLAVTISPVAPSPGEIITVTAEVESEPTDWHPDILLEYHGYFASSVRGGGPMHSSGGHLYSRDIGSFLNGTEIWVVVVAYIGSAEPDVNADCVIQIGTVLRGGPSGLLIENLSHSSQQPKRGDTIQVTADVVTSSTLTGVTLIFAHISSTDFGMANRTMMAQPSGAFEATIENPFLFGYIYEPGTMIMYRVAASDATGNTALTVVRALSVG